MTEIKETGNCYEVAANIVFNDSSVSMRLVHGTILGRGKIAGLRTGHAWVETRQGEVIDFANGCKIKMKRAKYYREAKVEDMVSYSRLTAMQLTLSTKTYGPWTKEEYKKRGHE